ncbi:uncharacterized protein hrob [Vanacampus margaritifer]
MSCQLSGLFSIGDDFDDEELLGTNWAVRQPTTVPSHPVGVACVASRGSGTNLLQRSSSPCPSSTSKTVARTLRKLSSSTQAPEPYVGVQPRPAVTSPLSLPPATHVAPGDSATNLFQPNGTSAHPAFIKNTSALRNLTSGANALRSNAPPKLDFPEPQVGTQDRPSAAVPSCPLGQEIVAPTLRKLSSGTRACPQQSLTPTNVVALRPLGVTLAVPRDSNTNLLQPSGGSAHSLPPPTCNVTEPHLGAQQWPTTNVAAQDDFDDWDLDLADLEECERLAGPVVPVKMMRPTTGGGTLRAPTLTTPHLVTTFPPAPKSPSRTLDKPQQVAWKTPAPTRLPRGLFEAVSPAPIPAPSPSPSLAFSPHPLSTPLLTNHLVQLVSASNKVSRKRPCSEPQPPSRRRFPGPAGLLPQQPLSHSLDEIVVSVPQTPTHGVAARRPNQVSSSQADEEQFGGPWAAMKAEMGLDERNPACFLRSFSVVMVLRKAALKQLNKNKVPNMAVMLKSINHTHTDAKAVFRDPTGEIQGTVHRRLLEERLGELKVGAVLLLKQVGVFSPSHRNHYLNVTPNNLLRIYSPDGVCHTSGHLPPLVLEPTPLSPTVKPVSCMQLVFDDNDNGNDDGIKYKDGSLQTSGWDADDLDELLVALPEVTYGL